MPASHRERYTQAREDRLDFIFDQIDRGLDAVTIRNNLVVHGDSEDNIYSRLADEFCRALDGGKPFGDYTPITSNQLLTGEASEIHAKNALQNDPDIDLVVDSTRDQDENFSIDVWVLLGKKYAHRIVPVQTKSSSRHVSQFRRSVHYANMVKKFGLVVINGGDWRNPNNICRDFWVGFEKLSGTTVGWRY